MGLSIGVGQDVDTCRKFNIFKLWKFVRWRKNFSERMNGKKLFYEKLRGRGLGAVLCQSIAGSQNPMIQVQNKTCLHQSPRLGTQGKRTGRRSGINFLQVGNLHLFAPKNKSYSFSTFCRFSKGKSWASAKWKFHRYLWFHIKSKFLVKNWIWIPSMLVFALWTVIFYKNVIIFPNTLYFT